MKLPEEGFTLHAVECVALDVAKPKLHVQAGVTELTEPVVGQAELLTSDAHSVPSQAAVH